LLLVVLDALDIGGASLCAQALMLNAAAARAIMAMILMYFLFPSFLCRLLPVLLRGFDRAEQRKFLAWFPGDSSVRHFTVVSPPEFLR
jgi:hypothetical protein